MSLASDIIQKVQSGANKLIESGAQSVGTASEFVRKNPVTSAVGVSGGIVSGLAVTQIIRKKRKARAKTKKPKRKARKAKPKTRRKVSKKKKKSKQRKPYTAGKGKDTSSRRIRFTKNNQPYIILANGRARFIKKSSVARARKLKGGRY